MNHPTSPRDPSRVHVHVMPVKTLLTVAGALILLTVLTVAMTAVDTGAWEIWVSMGIASFKAALVALYFMHLRYDKSFNGLVFVTALVCLAIFLGFTLYDADIYSQTIQAVE